MTKKTIWNKAPGHALSPRGKPGRPRAGEGPLQTGPCSPSPFPRRHRGREDPSPRSRPRLTPSRIRVPAREPPHPQTAVHADGHPVGEHLLHHRLRAPQHELRVLGGRGVDEVHQQLLHDASVVLELAVQRDGQQGGQAAPAGRRRASAPAARREPTRVVALRRGLVHPAAAGVPAWVASGRRVNAAQTHPGKGPPPLPSTAAPVPVGPHLGRPGPGKGGTRGPGAGWMPTARQARGLGLARPSQVGLCGLQRPPSLSQSPRPDLSRTAKSFCCSSACTNTMRKCLLLSNEENRLIPSSMWGRQLSGICGSNRCCPQGSAASPWPRSQHL